MEGLNQEINFDPKKILIVPIDEVRPNTWNPKDKDSKDFQKVLSSVRTNGLKLPIVVRENNGYEIIDGEQRWKAAKQLQYKMALIYNEGVVTDTRAKELTIWYQQQVPFNDVDLAHLVAELVSSGDVVLPYEKEELDTFMKMAKFSVEDFKDAPIPDMKTTLLKTLMIRMTNDQYEVVMQAMAKVKETEGAELAEGRIIELICADYLAGN